jgi:two-component system OmpR family response regulator
VETQEEPRAPVDSNSKQPRKSVLVIDDCPDQLALLRTILEIDDYEIFTALSGKAALKVLTAINKPNLIFLDMNMEDMGGSDFLLMLESQMPDVVKEVPVVFLTGMDQVPKSKAVGYIRKPIDSIVSFLKDTRRFIETGAEKSAYEH